MTVIKSMFPNGDGMLEVFRICIDCELQLFSSFEVRPAMCRWLGFGAVYCGRRMVDDFMPMDPAGYDGSGTIPIFDGCMDQNRIECYEMYICVTDQGDEAGDGGDDVNVSE